MKLTTELVGDVNTKHPSDRTLRIVAGKPTWFGTKLTTSDLTDGLPVEVISRLRSMSYEEVLTVEQAKQLSSRALITFNEVRTRLETQTIDGVTYPVIHVNNPKYEHIGSYVIKVLEQLRHKHYTYLENDEIYNLQIVDMSVLLEDVFKLCEDMVNWRLNSSKYIKSPINPSTIANGYWLDDGGTAIGTIAFNMATGEILHPTINSIPDGVPNLVNKNLIPYKILHYNKAHVSLSVTFKKVGNKFFICNDRKFELSNTNKEHLTKYLNGYTI